VKLLFLNYEFPPVGGGAAQASLATAREFVTLGHRVDFLTISTEDAPSVEDLGGVRVHKVHAYRRGLHDVSMAGAMSFVAAAAWRLPRLAAEQDYDAYHYYFGLPTGLLTFVPGPHRERPYVVSLRGSDVPGYDPRLDGFHRALLPLTRRIWRGAARVVANSEGLQQLAVAAVPTQAIDVIRNGVHLPEPESRADRREASVRILAVSRLIERKGVDTLLHAVAGLASPAVTIDIAGDGPDRQALEDLARGLGLAGRVQFHWFTEREALADLYRRADVFALTSVAESCSMALLDAIAAGLPVVATQVGGNPELVEHGVNGLLARPGEASEFTAALDTLCRDRTRRLQYGERGRARAIARHSWKSVAMEYEAVLQAAVESHRRSRPAAVREARAARPVPVPRER
jgi:glycosyltransferase involved in cell wall biosynthesis